MPALARLALRFPTARLADWAARYPAEADDTVLRAAASARRRGYLTRREFLVLGDWKTPRSRPRRMRNAEGLVREATGLALSSRNEELKIGVLRILEGVDWPTASVILHLCDRGTYPILDVRALWSAGVDAPSPPYTFERWLAYTLFTRRLARDAGLSMREVDRALWQFAKERQSA
jgi:hypothetical protein